MNTPPIQKLRLRTRVPFCVEHEPYRLLTFIKVLMLTTLASTLLGMLVDPLVLTGQPA
jgi:hypothetical protein